VLEDVVDPNKLGSLCYSSVGNHCDSAGFLTHIDLSKSNMTCDLGLVLSEFQGNNRIKSFEVRFLRLASENASLIFSEGCPAWVRKWSHKWHKMCTEPDVHLTQQGSLT
jgi:hypothetical protein